MRSVGMRTRAAPSAQQLRAGSAVIPEWRENSRWRGAQVARQQCFKEPSSHSCVFHLVCVLRMKMMEKEENPRMDTVTFQLKKRFPEYVLILILTAL